MNCHCNDCHMDLPLEAMTPHHKHLCRSCSSKRMREWRSKNKERDKQTNIKSRLKLADKIKSKRRLKYLAGEPRNPNTSEVNRLWRINNREKVNAKAAVRLAIKNGVLNRPETCSYCNSNICIVAHHHDYTRRLDVVWLCQSCHRRLHSKHHHAIQDHVAK